jgi:hypothetical protein
MDTKSIEKALSFLGKGNCQYHVTRMATEDSTEIMVVSRVKVSQYDLMINGSKAIYSKLEELRNNLLQNDLFYNERKSLEEYERLSNMEFVLDALKELDLSSIKEQKQVPEYVDINLILGGKSGEDKSTTN